MATEGPSEKGSEPSKPNDAGESFERALTDEEHQELINICGGIDPVTLMRAQSDAAIVLARESGDEEGLEVCEFRVCSSKHPRSYRQQLANILVNNGRTPEFYQSLVDNSTTLELRRGEARRLHEVLKNLLETEGE